MKEGFLDSYGYKVHYIHWDGKGPKILLIHSMGLDAHSMDKLAESLNNMYSILSLTILGHGDSGSPSTQLPLNEHAEIMRNCYKQLGFSPSVLIGHSVGGMMGMILTAEYPKFHPLICGTNLITGSVVINKWNEEVLKIDAFSEVPSDYDINILDDPRVLSATNIYKADYHIGNFPQLDGAKVPYPFFVNPGNGYYPIKWLKRH